MSPFSQKPPKSESKLVKFQIGHESLVLKHNANDLCLPPKGLLHNNKMIAMIGHF